LQVLPAATVWFDTKTPAGNAVRRLKVPQPV